MIEIIIYLLASLFFLVKSAEYATNYAARLGKILHLSEFIVSFFIVSVISVFPEGTIAVMSAIQGVPSFGLGTLLGSNVADLTLVLGIVALFSLRGIPIKSEILKKDYYYLFLMIVPVLLGWDGHFSRTDGLLLLISGVFFFLTLSIESHMFRKKTNNIMHASFVNNFLLLIISLIVLLFSAKYTIDYGVALANKLNVPSVLIGLTIVSIGTCLPELFFSIKSVKKHKDSLALGDLLGTVITDATILVGITALIQPFNFNPNIIYVTGSAMFLACAFALLFIRTDRLLTKKEGLFLILFYILYLIVELLVNKI